MIEGEKSFLMKRNKVYTIRETRDKLNYKKM